MKPEFTPRPWKTLWVAVLPCREVPGVGIIGGPEAHLPADPSF